MLITSPDISGRGFLLPTPVPHRKNAPWYCLRDMNEDVALVQEACRVPDEVLSDIDTGPREHWDASVWNSCWWVGRFPHLVDRQTMIVKRKSSGVCVDWVNPAVRGSARRAID